MNYKHTCPRVKIKGGWIFKIAGGPPKFWVLLHLYVTISKIFPILTSLRGGRGWGLQGLRGGSYPPSPPFGHVCHQSSTHNVLRWEKVQSKTYTTLYLLCLKIFNQFETSCSITFLNCTLFKDFLSNVTEV